MKLCFAWLLAATLGAMQAEGQESVAAAHNVLVVVLDDVGSDMLSCYGAPDAPATPALDALAARGVRFTRAYANPWCSPTRAAMLTGRYAFRTQIGFPINPGFDSVVLADEEITLPELLARARPGAFDSSAIGKWHLSKIDDLDAPRRHGFGWYEGWAPNFEKNESYVAPHEVRNGELVALGRYATTEEIDDTLARSRAMREPWLLYTGLHLAHEPLHWPPGELAGTPPPEGREPTRTELFHAMVRAADRELGRLFAGLGPELSARTHVIVISDNGTLGSSYSDTRRRERAKGTLYEGGIRVPLIVAGPAVKDPGRASDELVGAVDLFATVAELFGVDARAVLPAERELDSRSFAALLRDPQARSPRTSVLCEEFRPNGPGPYTESHRVLVSARGKLACDVGRPRRYSDLSVGLEGSGYRVEELKGELKADCATLLADHDALFGPTTSKNER